MSNIPLNEPPFLLFDLLFTEDWKPSYDKTLLKNMGYDYVGSMKTRTGADFFVDKKNGKQKKTKSDVKKVIQNFNKKDHLHDPPAMGISLPKHMKG